MSKHTPGPWDFFTRLKDDGSAIKDPGLHRRVIFGSGGQGFARTVGLSREGVDEANARLIAAAPELLEVAREALEFMEANTLGGDDTKASINKARAAIAKATGETK